MSYVHHKPLSSATEGLRILNPGRIARGKGKFIRDITIHELTAHFSCRLVIIELLNFIGANK